MNREIDDAEYMECLPYLYRKNYTRWKERMLRQIGDIVHALETTPLEQVMETYSLTPRDVALLVRLNYVTAEEAHVFGMDAVERTVPS